MAGVTDNRIWPDRPFIDLAVDSVDSDCDLEEEDAQPSPSNALCTIWQARSRRRNDSPEPSNLDSENAISQWQPRKQPQPKHSAKHEPASASSVKKRKINESVQDTASSLGIDGSKASTTDAAVNEPLSNSPVLTTESKYMNGAFSFPRETDVSSDLPVSKSLSDQHEEDREMQDLVSGAEILEDEIDPAYLANSRSERELQATANGLSSAKNSDPASPPGVTEPVLNGGLTSSTCDHNAITTTRLNAVEFLDKFASMPLAQKTQALVDEVGKLDLGKLVTWTVQEDALLIHAKEELQLKWYDIHSRFLRHRGRDWHGCQGEYSQKLAIRPRTQKSAFILPTVTSTSDEDVITDKVGGPRKAGTIRIRSSWRTGPSTTVKRPVSPSSTRRARFTGQSESYAIEVVEDWGAQRASETRKTTRSKPNIKLPLFSSFIPTSSTNPSYEARIKQLNEKQRTAGALASATTKLMPPSRLPSQDANERPTRHSACIPRPYLNFQERQYLIASIERGQWQHGNIEWENQILHVDFTDAEIRHLAPFIFKVMIDHNLETSSQPLTSHLSHVLGPATPQDLKKIARRAQTDGGTSNRTVDSIVAFLQDLASGNLNSHNTSYRIGISRPLNYISLLPINAQLRHREGGSSTYNARISSGLQARLEDSMGPCLSFTGCSGDANAVAWAPDGDSFAIASAALADDHSMQYNQPNNLLFGTMTKKTLMELPYHAIKRPRTEEGPNSSESMHTSQDPLLFKSVSAVQFAPRGDAMVSTGYDNFARVWDLRRKGSTPTCSLSFEHKAEVDVMAINARGLIATGSKRFTDFSVQLMKYDFETQNLQSLRLNKGLDSPKAKRFPNKELHPTCLRWGNEIWDQQRYLLCGFSSKLADFGDGETCLWDVEAEAMVANTAAPTTRGGRSVFDIAWSPLTFGRFAVGSTRGQNVNKGTNSIISIYDSRWIQDNLECTMQVSGSKTFELECPAYDMNDVLFNPADEFLISTGCTNGSVYIWDLRNPHQILHKLSHGPPATELDANVPREEADTGVRFLSWGSSRRCLYSGSSDGVIAQWDPYQSSDDVFLRKVVELNSGIMCGSFSPDYSKVLLGEVNGSVMMLSVGHQDVRVKDCERLKMQKAERVTINEVREDLGIAPIDARANQSLGRSSARELVDSGQIQFRPFGDLPFRQAVQGPNYIGPYDHAVDSEELRIVAQSFQNKFKLSESSHREIRDKKSEITEEEMGDSRAWRARLPHNVRTKSESSKRSEDGFACFRCRGDLSHRPGDNDVLECNECFHKWRMDVLGYTFLPGTKKSDTAGDNTVRMEASKRKAMSNTFDEEYDLAFMNRLDDERAELQNVEDYYHNLWSNRPTLSDGPNQNVQRPV